MKVDDEHGVPRTLVERAVALKRESARESRRERDSFKAVDEIWCVFDTDSHPNLHDAIQQATAHAINLAISNPCFELWILLHFREHTAFIDRGPLRALCQVHLPTYDKRILFSDLADVHDEAQRRAQQLSVRNAQLGDPLRNPSTGVHKLTSRLLELGTLALRR